ncbi:MAG: hypothetical protein KF721_06270, partial [Ignavibacteriaceae bacterium]|nr:hypothetical protein [Ignavibacteriaceae bacterium]
MLKSILVFVIFFSFSIFGQYSISFDQKLSNGNSYGKIGVWSNGTFLETNVPFTTILSEGTHYFRADTNVVNLSSVEKFHNWNYGLDYRNFKVENITSSGSFLARLNPIGTAKIKNLIEQKYIPGEPIQPDPIDLSWLQLGFIDPWLRVDESIPAKGLRNYGMDATWRIINNGEEFTLNSHYKGVFLNQNPTYNPLFPKYSIYAPDYQICLPNGNGGVCNLYDFHFQNWVSNGKASFQNANAAYGGVVFTQSGAEIYAEYKGVGITTKATSFQSNSQQKVVKTTQQATVGSLMYRIYESMGDIWIERSSNNGDAWTLWNDKKKLNDNPAHSASIDNVINIGEDWLVVSYVEGRYLVMMVLPTKKWTNTPAWVGKVVYMLEINSSSAAPTIAGYDNNKFIVVSRISDSEDGLYALYGEITVTENLPSITLRTPSEISGTNINSINPSIAVLETGSNHIYHLVYEESNAIKYAKLQRGSDQNVSVDLLESTTLSTGSGYQYNRYPSLTVMNDNYARVTWQGTRYTLPQDIELGKVNKSDNQNSN